MSTEVLCECLRHSPLLVSFICPNLSRRDDCLDILTSHCPRLKVLGIGNFGTGTAALTRLLQGSTALEVLDLLTPYHEEDSVTGPQFEAITRHGINIRALSFILMDMSELSALLTICHMPVLSHLHICSLELLSDEVWEALAACVHFCANLRELDLQFLSGTFSDEAFCAFLGRLSHLKRLCLSASERVNDAVLRTISCSSTLEELDINQCSNYTDQAIMALAEGCPALRSLHIGTVETPFTPVVHHLWQLLRPPAGVQCPYRP